ncbi:unnamed protein product [Rotaria sp. Silwood2]|nr:unnamed protein product [Rotaria sp. Silwood2]
MHNHVKHHKNQYFFGLRDYYSLIGGIVRAMSEKQHGHNNLYDIIHLLLAINFDSIIDGGRFMWRKFCEHMQNNHMIEYYSCPTVDVLINQSISSRTGRFLMLISDNESSFDYIQQYINVKYALMQTHSLVGSTLAGDFLSNETYTEQYNTRIMMDIILYVETDVTLFVRGLGHLYDNLYDLFNQNFSVSGRKKYCRIALGSLFHPRCMIHDRLFCIVFVKKQDLHKYDPPFLNRFEKHTINLDTFIPKHQKTTVSNLMKWVNEYSSKKPNQKFPCHKHLVEFNNDYIFNLVADAYHRLGISNDYDIDQEAINTQKVIKYCQDHMIRASSFDFPLILSLTSQTNLTKDINPCIERYYEIHADMSFSSLINQKLETDDVPKLIVYTYTQIYQIIDYSHIKNHNIWLEQVKLSYFKTELELIQRIETHYRKKDSLLLFIRIDYHQEHKHIPMLKHILLNRHVTDKKHGICLIVHLQRNMLNIITDDVFFNWWSTIMIDNLQEHRIIPKNIFFNPSYQDLINHFKFLSSETMFDELIKRCLSKFRYQETSKYFEDKIIERRERIINELTIQTVTDDNDHQSLRSLIKNQLLLIENTTDQSLFNDWRQDLLGNEIIIGSCRSFDHALKQTVWLYLENYLSLILAHLEKHSLIDSYLVFTQFNGDIRNKLFLIWLNSWTEAIKTIDVSLINQQNIEISLIFYLYLPCSTYEYEIIREIRQTIAQNQYMDDDHRMNFAWKQLISKSIYGQYIDTIFQNSDLFKYYYHDQLTIILNKMNIHQVSSSFIQQLISKLSVSPKDRLTHVFIHYEELCEIMRIFDIGLPLIDKEEKLFEILSQQFKNYNENHENISRNNTNLFYIILDGKTMYGIPPKSSLENKFEFINQSDPFIEISFRNLIELLLSSTSFNRIKNIQQLITAYGIIIQSMFKLKKNEITNFENFHSFHCLACCISILFPNNEAFNVFLQISRYYNFCISFKTLDQIHLFIAYLEDIIDKKQSTVDKTIIHQTLNKLENELLRNWLIENANESGDILRFMSKTGHNLWKYSGKMLMVIDKRLGLSKMTQTYKGNIPDDDEYKEIDQYLCQLNDSTRKVEILMSTYINIRLLLDEKYEPQFVKENSRAVLSMLSETFNDFKENINQIEDESNLKLITLIAWIKYYLQYYAYTLKLDINHDTINEINDFLNHNTSAFCLTMKLFIIKQLCHYHQVTLYDLYKCNNRLADKILSSFQSSSDQQASSAQSRMIPPTPLYECHDKFININRKIGANIDKDELEKLIQECSTNHELTPEKAEQLEKLIEDKLILVHANSVISDIREYKILYADFVYGNNKEQMLEVYNKFLDAWYAIDLNEVNFDNKKHEFQRSLPKHNFANRTNISIFLLNKSNYGEGRLSVACLQTLGNLQNDIVDYFHSHVVNSTNKHDKYYYRTIPIQDIQEKHLFRFDSHEIRKLLIDKGITINYTYGMSQDIIYDYDEVEWEFRTEASRLPFIETKNIRFFNYQFELYDDNISLISDIRSRLEQKLFNDNERIKFKSLLDNMENDSLHQLAGNTKQQLKKIMSFTTEDLQKYVGQNVRNVKQELESEGCEVHLVCTGRFATGCVPPRQFVAGESESERKKRVVVSYNGDDPDEKITSIRLDAH